jgi:hypothetical protein
MQRRYFFADAEASSSGCVGRRQASRRRYRLYDQAGAGADVAGMRPAYSPRQAMPTASATVVVTQRKERRAGVRV